MPAVIQKQQKPFRPAKRYDLSFVKPFLDDVEHPNQRDAPPEAADLSFKDDSAYSLGFNEFDQDSKITASPIMMSSLLVAAPYHAAHEETLPTLVQAENIASQATSRASQYAFAQGASIEEVLLLTQRLYLELNQRIHERVADPDFRNITKRELKIEELEQENSSRFSFSELDPFSPIILPSRPKSAHDRLLAEQAVLEVSYLAQDIEAEQIISELHEELARASEEQEGRLREEHIEGRAALSVSEMASHLERLARQRVYGNVAIEEPERLRIAENVAERMKHAAFALEGHLEASQHETRTPRLYGYRKLDGELDQGLAYRPDPELEQLYFQEAA